MRGPLDRDIVRLIAGWAALPAVLWLAACGGEELTTEEFIEMAGENGAEVTLGRSLFAAEEDKELRAIKVRPASVPRDMPAGEPIEGSLAVLDDSDAATEEIEECRVAPDLLCYQAGNVVVTVEKGGNPTALAALNTAVSKMGD